MFKPLGTKMIGQDLFVVNAFFCNFYLFKAGDSFAAFDAGMYKGHSGMGLRKLGIDPACVSHVFLTHSDYDHMGGIKLFEDAEVFLSEEEVPMVTHERPRMLMKYNRRLAGYHALADGEVVMVGENRIRILHTPGHTPGSACYFINDSILVCGDTIMLSLKNEITPFSVVQNMDHRANKKTVNRLKQEGIFDRADLLLTAHSGIKRMR